MMILLPSQIVDKLTNIDGALIGPGQAVDSIKNNPELFPIEEPVIP